MPATRLSGPGGRVAVVDGLRTPFARIATHYRDYNAIELGEMVVREMMQRNSLNEADLDQLIYGMTIMIPEAPFIAREIAIACGMDNLDAWSLTRACATSFQTAASAANNIVNGYSDIIIAGGVDSSSDVRIPMSSKFSSIMRDVAFAKTMGEG